MSSAIPEGLSKLDICYAEDFPRDSLLALLQGYENVLFQNGSVSVALENRDLRDNQKLIVLLLGALTDTAALIRANRNSVFISRLSAATAYRGNVNQITESVLDLTVAYFKADMGVLCLKRDLARPEHTHTAAMGVDAADVTVFGAEVDAALQQQQPLLWEPKVIEGPHPLFHHLPGSGLKVLVIIPLMDEGQYWGFVAIGGAKRSFAKDAGHDLLVNIARRVASTYRRHFGKSVV